MSILGLAGRAWLGLWFFLCTEERFELLLHFGIIGIRVFEVTKFLPGICTRTELRSSHHPPHFVHGEQDRGHDAQDDENTPHPMANQRRLRGRDGD